MAVPKSAPAFVQVHGSANWMQVTDYITEEGVGIQREQLIEAAAGLTRTEKFIVAGPGTTQYALYGAVPAIAVPAEPKAAFVCPIDHIRALTLALPQVDHILCVGWRGADRNLIDLMKGLIAPSVRSMIGTRRSGTPEQGGEAPTIPERSDGTVAWVRKAGITRGCEIARSGFSGFVTQFLPGFIASLPGEAST